MKNRNRFAPVSLTLSLAVVMLAGCATRPPRQGTSTSNRMGPPPEPVMPPTYQGTRQTLPPPQVVTFETSLPATQLPPPVSAPQLQPRKGTSYTVRKGESLSAIAARNRMSWKELAAYNYITDPNKVRVGQVILIPAKGEAAPVASPVRNVTPPATPAASGSTYVVQSGDSLSVIAQRNGTSVAALKSANGLSSDRLLVGQILKLPSGASAGNAGSVEQAPRPTPVPTRPMPTPRPVLDTPEFESNVGTPREEVVVESDDPIVSKAFPIVVQEGDTLESISNNYIVPVEEIRKLNNLPANAEVTPGQKLQIPPSVY